MVVAGDLDPARLQVPDRFVPPPDDVLHVLVRGVARTRALERGHAVVQRRRTDRRHLVQAGQHRVHRVGGPDQVHRQPRALGQPGARFQADLVADAVEPLGELVDAVLPGT